MSAVDAEAHNAAVMSAGIARERLDRIGQLEGKLHRLGRIAHFGSANDPAPGMVSVPSMTAAASTVDRSPEQPTKKTGSTSAEKPGSTQQPCGLQQV